jgi:hypothetical protein
VECLRSGCEERENRQCLFFGGSRKFVNEIGEIWME